MAQRPKVVAFDIIGTVFTLEPLRRPLEDAGLPAGALDLWFAQGLRDSFALAASGRYAPFRSILQSALEGLLALNRVAGAGQCVGDTFERMGRLPPYEDADEAFGTLESNGLRIMALSNGSPAFVRGLLESAALARHVERIVSVDDVACLKPRREIYEHAARAAGVEPGRLALVASHAWDIHGAGTAGLLTAFVARGKPFPPVMKSPGVIGETLSEAVRKLVALAP